MTSAVKGFPEKFPVRDDDRRPARYWIAASLGREYLRVLSWRRLRIEGENHIPDGGPLLVASNHTSNRDPLVLGAYFPHTLFAMGKREMYANRLFAWFLAGCNCIPVNRGGADRRAVSRALDVLRKGRRLLIFVEGTRSRDGTMHRAEAGIGFLARKSGAMILPVAISGTDGRGKRRGILRRREIVLSYGEPFVADLTAAGGDSAIADQIAERIAALLPPSRRGAYARTAEGLPAPR
jgi:1-acyl-sn-glycerol-3-phosphate acyltransferase